MFTRRHVLATLLTIWATACASPLPVDRDEGSAVRVVSLVPAATEMLFVMGAGSNVVGVSSFDTFPPEVAALPRVGALVDPDFEQILTLRPTLVVVYESQEDLISRLDRASVPVYHYRHAVADGLGDITRTMRRLGTRVGRAQEAADAASRIERELADVQARVRTLPRPATALVFGREPGALRGIYVSGGIGFLHDLLDAAGARNVFEDVQRENLQASTEIMLARTPEVIIELRTSAATPERLGDELTVWNRLPALPAVRSGRVYILTDPALSIPGPRIGAAARALADVLHPDTE